MKDYRRWLLDALLAKYERSRHYREPGRSTKPVSFHFNRRSFPDYFIDNTADYRLAIHRVCRELAGEGLVRLHWAPLAEGQELHRLDLNLDRVDEAYAEARRTPRRRLEQEVQTTAVRWGEVWRERREERSADGSNDGRGSPLEGGAPPDPFAWLYSFAMDIARAAQEGRRLPAGFKPQETGLLDEVCRVLDAMARLDGEVPRRVLSLQALGSSKRLEQIQPRLVRVLREYAAEGGRLQQEGDDPSDARALLAELGVVDNPEQIRLGGTLRLRTPQGVVDTGLFRPDVGLPAAMVRQAELVGLEAERVVTIENLTSYYVFLDTVPVRTLTVYLGGYHTPGRRLLLEKLRDFAGGHLRFYHWGDIDLGGFQIFHHLRTACGLPLEPLYMDRETLLRYRGQAQPLQKSYARKLEALLQREDYAAFHEVIRTMLDYGLRLEQESVMPEGSGLWG